jgi:hypothetical protein
MADLWDDPNLTFSKVVLNWLLRRDSRILTTRFNRSLIDAMELQVDKEELASLLLGSQDPRGRLEQDEDYSRRLPNRS